MPPLDRPSHPQTVTLPGREATVAAETDVLVIGGGPAGLGAALGATGAGARVILAEHHGFLGGTATAALVEPLASYYTPNLRPTQPGSTTFLPGDQGPAEPVIRGVLATLVERLVDAGGAIPPSVETGYATPFDAEILKLVAQDMLDEAGVRLLFHALATGVLGDGTVEGVVFETKSGPLVIRARCVVDCTGDGDVAASAGAPFELGREEDGFPQPMTLMFHLGGIDREEFAAYVAENPGQWFGVFGLWDLIMRAVETGEYSPPREDILLFATTRESEAAANCTRVPKVIATDAWDLSRAEWEGRRQVRAVSEFLRMHVPGFAASYIAKSGSSIGVRETRRILGGYVLTVEDVLNAHKFDDVIARNAYPVDIHNPLGRGTKLRRLPNGESHDIPLRCLIPRDVDGLLVAGRCISTTHEALSSLRVMPTSMATGQAAGVAAAMSALRGTPPRDVPVREVQYELVRQGADVRGAEREAHFR